MTEEEKRPSPESLLKEAKNERLGKLKIFLGAAPGVGKTYSMLNAAKARLADNVDIVIGIVETHQRSETQALAQDIETIARQKIDYRGLSFEEMDIDAILKRKPKLVLIDELAHTNIPGARHPKRYQDVEEVLEAGIDVYTTLNVQHIESLNDIVTRITGVKVRETVPDSLIQRANAIELIDLPPDELLQRLKEGKVYIPEQARLAVNRFFTPSNLTALRELALRQAAERVDEQMTNLMRRHAIAGPWPTSNRLMVCISDDGQAASLVRAARRNAEKRQASWIVFYVETSRHANLSEKSRTDIAQAFALGESMGAESVSVVGEDVPGEVLRFARERNVTTLIVGKSQRSIWSRLMRPSVSEALIQKGHGFDLLLINDTELKPRGSDQQKYLVTSEAKPWKPNWGFFIKSGVVVGLAFVVASLTSAIVPTILLPFYFIMAVLFVALDTDVASSIWATFLSVIALFFLVAIPSGFDFAMESLDAYASIAFFAAVGIGISLVADRVHMQMKSIKNHAERTQSLYDFTKSIAAAASIDDVAQATVRRVAITLGAHVAVLLPQNNRLEIVAAVPADLTLDTASDAAMDWVWRHKKPAGYQSDTLPSAPFYGLPLTAGANTLGVITVKVKDGSTLTSAQNNFLLGVTYQAASAIERAKLSTDVAQARLQTEMEKLRTNLLSSVSHDMRAPLDSIILTARDLSVDWDLIKPDKRRELVTNIEHESDRLDRFIENFLDMTELVTESMHYRFDAARLRDVVELAVIRLSRRLREREVIIDIPPELPLIEMDGDIMRRVFVNIIENCCSYSLPDQPIKIIAHHEADNVKISVIDNGVGIPESERLRVFDMFYRVKKGATINEPIAGAGLGLSICRGFVEAHNGHISAHPGEDGTGTNIVIVLPVKRAITVTDAHEDMSNTTGT